MKLTDDLIRKTPAPAAGSITLWDGGPDRVRGFGIRINSPTKRSTTGAKSFFINYRHDGREARYTIGAYPTWTVTAARARAKELRREIDNGADPAVAQACEARGADGSRPDRPLHCRSFAEPSRSANRLLTARCWPRSAATSGRIAWSPPCITATSRACTKRSPRVAGRFVPIVLLASAQRRSQPFTATACWRGCTLARPGTGQSMQGRRAQPRARARTILCPDRTRRDQRCARRVSEPDGGRLRSACDVDRLPAGRSYGGASGRSSMSSPAIGSSRARTPSNGKLTGCRLTPAALELIGRRRQTRASDWVFPSERTDEPIATLWHVWEHTREHAKLGKTARLYDLRHTFASVGAGGGLSLQVLGRLLGHTLSRTTERYAHLADDPLREAADKIGAVIAGSTSNKSGAPVVQIKGRVS